METGDNKSATLPSQPRHSPVIAPKKEYCYQCQRSQYRIYPARNGKLSLWCPFKPFKQEHLPKDSKVGDCEGFANIKVPEYWRKIQRERGTLE